MFKGLAKSLELLVYGPCNASTSYTLAKELMLEYSRVINWLMMDLNEPHFLHWLMHQVDQEKPISCFKSLSMTSKPPELEDMKLGCVVFKITMTRLKNSSSASRGTKFWISNSHQPSWLCSSLNSKSKHLAGKWNDKLPFHLLLSKSRIPVVDNVQICRNKGVMFGWHQRAWPTK